MTISFLDLKASYVELQDEIDAAVARVLSSGWYIQGPEVTSFEQDFARFCEAGHCVGVGNGLEALHLALLAMNVGKGDEVIVASNTFIATWLAVSMVGAVPVPVEPDAATHNINSDRIEAAITGRTKIILPTHLYGQPADLDPILEIARRHGIQVLEDAAQAHGARYKGKRIGGHSDAVAWSFYPGKNLGAFGDGGAVTSDHPEIVERVRLLSNYGSHRKYFHDVQGLNSRLDPVHAAVLAVKLGHLDAWNARRAAIASRYSDELEGSGIEVPNVPKWAQPSWHLYVIQSCDRDGLADRLLEFGVHTLIHYPVPPHLQGAYAGMGLSNGSFPTAERLAKKVLSLPIGPHLMSEQVDAVVAAVRTVA